MASDGQKGAKRNGSLIVYVCCEDGENVFFVISQKPLTIHPSPLRPSSDSSDSSYSSDSSDSSDHLT